MHAFCRGMHIQGPNSVNNRGVIEEIRILKVDRGQN
jgi:hypothetical protein